MEAAASASILRLHASGYRVRTLRSTDSSGAGEKWKNHWGAGLASGMQEGPQERTCVTKCSPRDDRRRAQRSAQPSFAVRSSCPRDARTSGLSLLRMLSDVKNGPSGLSLYYSMSLNTCRGTTPGQADDLALAPRPL